MVKNTKYKPTAMLSCLIRMKSRMEPMTSSISKVYTVYAKFCNETTLHGLKHTVANNFHFFERLLWFVLTVCAFAGAVYCGVSQLARYNSEPVVVSMQRDYRDWSTAFPAVTVCFLERIEMDKAKDVILRIWNVTEDTDSEKYKYYYEFVELIAEISFRSNLQNFWKYQNDDTVKNIDLLKLAVQVHPDFSLKVTTSQKIKVEWMPVITEEGLCMTFNSEYALYQIVNDELWKKQSLMKCHYHSESCFVRIDSMENGARVSIELLEYFVHSPFDIATAISNPTSEIFPGDELVTDFKVVEIQASSTIKSLRPEQRRCRYPDEWLAKSIKAYSFGLCQMHCRSRMAVMFCGCRPYFHVKGDGDICDAHGMACIGRNVEILVNLPKNLAKCPCMPQCAELNYYSHTKKVIIRFGFMFFIMFIFFNMNETTEDPAEAIVKFTLMPPKFRLHRDILFSLDDLFSSLGGTTSLFVGTSVLTVVETCLFIIRYIVSLIVDWYTAKKVVLERQ